MKLAGTEMKDADGQANARTRASGIDRRESLIKGARFAGAAVLAGSLGTLVASCGGTVTTGPTADTSTETPQSGITPTPDASGGKVAAVDSATCRAYNGQHCLMCMSACRENAIYSQDGHPVVDGSRCSGCGKCRFACPTDPASISVTSIN